MDSSTTTLATSSCPVGGAGDVYGTTKTVQGTIGSGYPVGKDTSWMDHTAGSSAEYSARFGVASDSVGYFQQTSTRALDRGAGFTWDREAYARSYRVALTYRKILHYYDRCPGQPPYYSSWVPAGYPGGYGENDNVSRPNWGHCQQITSNGTWWRSASDGSSYSLSTGVKIASVVGVDLSSKRAYNAEAKLAYHITAGRWVCGSNTVPSKAAKVMERYHNS